MPNRRQVQWLVPCLLLLLAACGPRGQVAAPGENAQPAPGSPTPAAVQAEAPAGGTHLELSMPPGVLRSTLVAQEAGTKWRLYDASKRPVAEFKVQSDRVKVRDAQDREILKVKRKADGFELEDAAGRRLLRAKRKDGGWKVSDGSDVLVARVTTEADGLRVEDAQGRVVARVKAGGSGEVRFAGSSGEDQARVLGVGDPQAAVWFLVPGLEPVAQAALVVYSMEVR